MKHNQPPHIPLPPELDAWIAEQSKGVDRGIADAWAFAAHAAPQAPAPKPERAAAIWAELDRVAAQESGRITHLRVLRKPMNIIRFASVAAAAVIIFGLSLQAWLQPTTVAVPFGETVAVTLPDGSVATLNSGAELTYERSFGDVDRRVRLTGEAFFAVEKGTVPFIVETFNAETEVLGTRFNVRAWPNEFQPETEVVLEEGRVQIARLSADAPPTPLAPGMKATITNGVVATDSTNLRYALAWREGNFSFDDQPLAEVFDELERRYNVSIALDEQLATLRHALFMNQPEDVEVVIADIAVTHGLNYRPIVNGYQVYVP